MSVSEIIVAASSLLGAVGYGLPRLLPLLSDRANKRAGRLARAKK